MKHSKSSPLGLYTIGIAALFLAGFLLLVVFGAKNYQSTVNVQNGNMETRSVLSYLATTVRAYDAAGAISVEETQEGACLRIADGDTGYALRIYQRDGELLEDYAPADAALQPEEAQPIGPTRTLDIQRLDGGLLRIRTDEGQVLLHLRSEEGRS